MHSEIDHVEPMNRPRLLSNTVVTDVEPHLHWRTWLVLFAGCFCWMGINWCVSISSGYGGIPSSTTDATPFASSRGVSATGEVLVLSRSRLAQRLNSSHTRLQGSGSATLSQTSEGATLPCGLVKASWCHSESEARASALCNIETDAAHDFPRVAITPIFGVISDFSA
jgi:phage terminase large subunit-like protein